MPKLEYKAQDNDIICPIIKRELLMNPYIKATDIAKKYKMPKRRVQYHMTYHITSDDRLSAIKTFIDNIKTTDFPIETDLAYIAGFLDADGYLYLGRAKSKTAKRCWGWRIRIGFSNTDFNVIEWIRKTVGGHIDGREPKNLSNNTYKSKKTIYNLNLSSNQTRKFLPLITPYLKIKREQAKVIMEALSISSSGKSISGKEMIRMFELEDKMRVLHGKKPRNNNI